MLVRLRDVASAEPSIGVKDLSSSVIGRTFAWWFWPGQGTMRSAPAGHQGAEHRACRGPVV